MMQYRAELEALFELPPRVAPYALIPVGFPLGRFGPLSRLPVEQLLHYDRWTGRDDAVRSTARRRPGGRRP